MLKDKAVLRAQMNILEMEKSQINESSRRSKKDNKYISRDRKFQENSLGNVYTPRRNRDTNHAECVENQGTTRKHVINGIGKFSVPGHREDVTWKNRNLEKSGYAKMTSTQLTCIQIKGACHMYKLNALMWRTLRVKEEDLMTGILIVGVLDT